MEIFDGSKRDITDFASEQFLQINSCGFQNKFVSNTVVRREGRSDYHILLINRGECEVRHGGEIYSIGRGGFVIYYPNEAQEYTFTSGTTSLWCHFTGTAIAELLESCRLFSGVYSPQPERSVFDSFTNMIQRFNQPGMRKFANVFLLELIYRLSDALTKPDNNEKQDIIMPVLTYINANYNKQLTLEELAERSGYSKSRFSHIFSDVMHTTPVKYQNEISLNAAAEMLTATSLSITEIALSCGFSDPLYFSRLFKKRYGIPPSEYRTQKSD